MSGYRGVGQIVRFNWPWYAAALSVTGAAIGVGCSGLLVGPWRLAVAVLLVLADGWLLLSLVVSHAIYDRSGVARGEWLRGMTAANVVVCHFGQDEATAHVARWLPQATLQTVDLYAADALGTPSLRRARALAGKREGLPSVPRAAMPCAPGSVDLVVLAFAAHEVRDHAGRARLFEDLAQCLAPDGRLLVIEHLRDAWNLLAYGPGVFHFFSRRTWLGAFAQAGLAVVRESPLTPWVCRFELRRTP